MYDEKKIILLVDDDEINLALMMELLEDSDYHSLTAYNAEEAMKVVEKNNISLIFLDRMMPGINGIEFAKKLKSDSRYQHIPIIMQSAAATKEQVAEGKASGVEEYFTKPYSEDTFHKAITHYLAS